MKNIVLSAFLSLFSIHGYADIEFFLDGEQAISLRDALVQAGASAPFIFEGRFIRVANIHVARTAGFMPYAEAYFDDDQKGGIKDNAKNQPALNLFEKLVKVGVKPDFVVEADKQHIFIQSIDCSPLGSPNEYRCEVLSPKMFPGLNDRVVDNTQNNFNKRNGNQKSDQCHSGQYFCNDRCISRWQACEQIEFKISGSQESKKLPVHNPQISNMGESITIENKIPDGFIAIARGVSAAGLERKFRAEGCKSLPTKSDALGMCKSAELKDCQITQSWVDRYCDPRNQRCYC